MTTDSPVTLAIRQNLMRTYKFLTDFLAHHGLTHIASYGTVLGAVRHHGFIPWDDDIDLCMFRQDYNQLLSLRPALQKEGYDIVSYNDKGYYLPFAKIVDLSTTLWEHKQLPFLLGNFIDIFPLDSFNVTDSELENMRRRSRRLFYRYQGAITDDHGIVSIIEYLRTRHFGSAARALMSFAYGAAPDKYLARYTDYINSLTGQTGDKCVYITSGIPAIFQKSWFQDTITVPFEDTTLPIPRDYAPYLKELYGDWQTPPPENKQTATHGDVRYYINLKERLTLDQVRKRIAQGEHCVI